MKIGFTGTQDGMTERQQQALLFIIEEYWAEFHHGGCIGADAEAHVITAPYTTIILHPPINDYKQAVQPDECWESREPLDFLDRNQAIVDEVDILIAAPKEREEQLKSGTWATVRRARKKGIPVIILEP